VKRTTALWLTARVLGLCGVASLVVLTSLMHWPWYVWLLLILARAFFEAEEDVNQIRKRSSAKRDEAAVFFSKSRGGV
jgi:hypothetical protein